MNNKTENKDSYWQYIRGICIICVVLIHAKNGIEFENKLIGSWNFDYWLLLRQFINFPVAIFIFLSGYFTNIEAAKRPDVTYITKRGGKAPNTIFGVVNVLHVY